MELAANTASNKARAETTQLRITRDANTKSRVSTRVAGLVSADARARERTCRSHLEPDVKEQALAERDAAVNSPALEGSRGRQPPLPTKS